MLCLIQLAFCLLALFPSLLYLGYVYVAGHFDPRRSTHPKTRIDCFLFTKRFLLLLLELSLKNVLNQNIFSAFFSKLRQNTIFGKTKSGLFGSENIKQSGLGKLCKSVGSEYKPYCIHKIEIKNSIPNFL